MEGWGGEINSLMETQNIEKVVKLQTQAFFLVLKPNFLYANEFDLKDIERGSKLISARKVVYV